MGVAQILLVFAFVFALIAALFVETVQRASIVINFGWLAVAFWIASVIFGSSKFF